MIHVYVVQRGQGLGDDMAWEDLALFSTRKLADSFVKQLEHTIPSSHHHPDWEDGYTDDEQYEFQVFMLSLIENEKPFKKLIKEWDY